MKNETFQFGIGPSGILSVLSGTIATISWSALLKTISCSKEDADEFLGYIVDSCEEIYPTLHGSDNCHGTILDMEAAAATFDDGYPNPICEAIWSRFVQIQERTGADYLWILNENT